MGTSSAYGGPSGGTPLIPSWLGTEPGSSSRVEPADADAATGQNGPPLAAPPLPERPPMPASAEPNRFSGARNNFTRFISSGGSDRASLGRALSRYVETSSGGARQAAQRMGASRTTSAGLVNFLNSAVSGGLREALRSLNLESLAGRPIEEIFLGLAEYICPDGGTVDEGIAREAFMETIADLAEAGLTDLDALTVDQTQTIFEIYATNAIEARLCNDIGTNIITLPADVQEARQVQSQLRDFISRAVADALGAARVRGETLAQGTVLGFVTRVYEQAFGILQSLGEVEADRR